MMVVDDDVPGEVHHRDHHAHAREAGEQRRDHARAAEDLEQRRRRRLLDVVVAGDQLCDLPRIGPHHQHEPERDERDPAGDEPGDRQDARVEVLAREEREEDRRPEDRAKHGAAEDVGDSSCPPLGRVHVTRRGADEQRDAARRSDEREAEDDRHRLLRRRAERRRDTTDRSEREPRREHRDPANTIHRAAGGEGRQRGGGEEDRRPEPQELVVAGDEHEREARDRGDELEDSRVDRQNARQEQGVPADRKLGGGRGHETD